MRPPARRLRRWCRGGIALAALAPASLAAQDRGAVPEALVHGREVSFRTAEGRVSGELLAVDDARLFLLRQGTVAPYALDEVGAVSVRQHGLDGGRVATWALAGSLISGGGLTAACASVDSGGCGGVFVAVAVAWALVGGVSALALHGSSALEVVATPGALRRYARFPQGLPEVFLARVHAGGEPFRPR